MSSEQIDRDGLISQLVDQVRRSSAMAVLLSQAVAERVGQNSTDMEAMDLLMLNGPMTAGRLSELTGLSTGAITGIADRLERTGLVRREPDLSDRRRVILRALPERIHSVIGPFYQGLAEATLALYDRYSDEELSLFVDMLNRSYDICLEHIAKLKAEPSAPKRSPALSKSRSQSD